MESGTSDSAVGLNHEGDESSMVSAAEASTHASPQRISSSDASEDCIAAGDDLSSGVEFFRPVASSIVSEIVEVEEDDPSLGVDPFLQTTSSTSDEQNSATSSPRMKGNPYMEDLPFMKDLSFMEDVLGENGYIELLAMHCFGLKQKLDNSLQKESVYAFLECKNMMTAQKQVQELFYLFEAIESTISIGKPLLKTKFLEATPYYHQYFEIDHLRIDIFCRLIIHALNYATKLRENPSVSQTNSNPTLVANWFEYFEVIDFIVFLINKMQEEEDIMDPLLILQKKYQEAKIKVTNSLHYYEDETISTFIWLVVNDKEEAEDLFKSLLKHIKPSDIINRGRVYNHALEKAHELFKGDTFLSSPSLSERYKNIQSNDQLDELISEHSNQVKVQRFLVDLYFKDVDLMQKINWEFVEEYDYPNLIVCLWECHKRMMVPNDLRYYNWTSTQLEYVFTSSATFVRGQNIMRHLLKAWPTLINATYKGLAALHVAAFKRNEEVIKFLFMQEGFDINVRTGQRNQVQSGQSSKKKWSKNRWKLSTYQTCLHIATEKRDAMVVKLLCEAPEPHKHILRCHEEDEENQTPLDILYNGLDKVGKDFESSQIEKMLLNKKDVQIGIDRLYRNRQVLVDAVNTILVGAALIAGVTFVGWIQPPLGYAQYYDLAMPYPTPPGTYDSYLAIRGNLGVKAFALFNSLSFFFAIATVIVGADAAFPSRRYKYIGHVVETMHVLLQRAIRFLIISLVCVLGAFGSAAIVVLPPSIFFRKDLILTIIIGGGVCGYALWQFLSRHSEKVRRFNASIRRIIRFTNVF